MEENPALEAGYRRLIRWWLIWANLPWLVMGAGIVFGGVPSILHYLSPVDGPFVLAFYGTIGLQQISAFYWIFFRGGAEDLIDHPGLLNVRVKKASWVKAFFVLNLISMVAVIMIFRSIVVPR
jgi:hypothetical protein